MPRPKLPAALSALIELLLMDVEKLSDLVFVSEFEPQSSLSVIWSDRIERSGADIGRLVMPGSLLVPISLLLFFEFASVCPPVPSSMEDSCAPAVPPLRPPPSLDKKTLSRCASSSLAC